MTEESTLNRFATLFEMQATGNDLAAYVTSIVLNGSNADIATTESSQVLLAYEHMDGEMCCDLTKPTAASTSSGLSEELRLQTNIWFDIYAKETLTTYKHL